MCLANLLRLVGKIRLLTKPFQVKQIYILSHDSSEIIHCSIPSLFIAHLYKINNILIHKSAVPGVTEFDPGVPLSTW